MKPNMTIVTLGTNNFADAVKFYKEGLLLPLHSNNGKIAFFDLVGTWLALYPKDLLAKDIGVEANDINTTSFTIAHNVKTKKEVNDILGVAKKAGAKIVKPAQDTFWGGYSGYFADLDGYYWEVAWNPHLKLYLDKIR